MSKDHEYYSIEKLETGAISALNEIPNISKVAKGAQKSFISFLAEWCPNCDYEAVQLREYYKNYETEFDFYLVMLFSSNELNNIERRSPKLHEYLIARMNRVGLVVQ